MVGFKNITVYFIKCSLIIILVFFISGSQACSGKRLGNQYRYEEFSLQLGWYSENEIEVGQG